MQKTKEGEKQSGKIKTYSKKNLCQRRRKRKNKTKNGTSKN